jgi:hypothetical protein
MDEQDNELVEEEGEMDVSEAAAGLVQAALNISAPEVLLPGDVKEVPEHLSRVKLGEKGDGNATSCHICEEIMPYHIDPYLVCSFSVSISPSPLLCYRQRAHQRALASWCSEGHQGWHPAFPTAQHVSG